jgi:hypothetical protein
MEWSWGQVADINAAENKYNVEDISDASALVGASQKTCMTDNGALRPSAAQRPLLWRENWTKATVGIALERVIFCLT